jgi:hypothetical protein
MKSITICLAVIIMVLTSNTIRANENDVNGLVNGSFEADGRIIDIVTPGSEPNGWDVNVPVLQFGGRVDNLYGVTDGNWSLTIYSKYNKTFKINDIAYVWQLVDLSDANRIFFDVHLDTYGGVWNPARRSALVMIDDNVVWESPKTGADIRGQYLNQSINVNYPEKKLHKLAIGIRADVNEISPIAIEYYTDWDNLSFSLLCNGLGFLDGDFNKDCRVDINDYCMLANLWMDEVEGYSVYNLSHAGDINSEGIINFGDFAVWAPLWEPNEPNSIVQLQQFTNIWLSQVPSDDGWNLYKSDDLPMRGVMNVEDLAIFARNWLEGIFE